MPGTSFQMVMREASKAYANMDAVKSEPSLPRVVVSLSAVWPINPCVIIRHRLGALVLQAFCQSIEMNFLPDVMVPCETCAGKRYNRETLEVRFKGKSIADVLNMTINGAVDFFENVPSILTKIKMLQEVGLGYIRLGQSSTTLSGGESQRIKLAAELARRDTGNTLYVLDEPTTGLHFEDIRVLLNVINKLVDRGNTVIIIEHNIDIIKCADHIIDLGPEGGEAGGQILATGTPEAVVDVVVLAIRGSC